MNYHVLGTAMSFGGHKKRILVPESLQKGITQSSKLVDIYTEALSVIKYGGEHAQVRVASRAQQPHLHLVLKVGALTCRWGRHELKIQRWENSKGLALAGVQRIGKGAARNKLGSDRRHPQCQGNELGFYLSVSH